jgi:hypothetical protein
MRIETYLDELNDTCQKMIDETNDQLREAECRNIQMIIQITKETVSKAKDMLEDAMGDIDEICGRIGELQKNPESAGAHEKHRQFN